MACIRRRRQRWVVDYRDAAGQRRWVTCQTKVEAEATLREALHQRTSPARPGLPVDILLSSYAERWLKLIQPVLKPRTLNSYEQMLRLYLIPAFGSFKLRLLSRGTIKLFLSQRLADGLAQNTVRIIHATLRAMLNAAIDDGVITANPANRLGRQLKLVQSRAERREDIKAFTCEQLVSLFEAARAHDPSLSSFWAVKARTGLRLGEMLALQADDVILQRRELRVQRAVSRGRIDLPKGRRARTVDLSLATVGVLREVITVRRQEALQRDAVPCWLFPSATGGVMDPSWVTKRFKRLLRLAGLPEHFTPHSLRHTYASLLLQLGVSPVYVQRQLGHASIQLTVDTYGRWLPVGDASAVDALDQTHGSKMVAADPSNLAHDV